MPRREWFRIKAQADGGDVADLWIYDVIGEWFGGVSAKELLDQLRTLPVETKTIRVHVNSPGGDPFDATAIHNLFRAQSAELGRTVEVLIEGIAASAATVVTSAGDAVKIARNALMMVHKPWGMAIGNADDMLELAQALETIEDSMVASYQRHSSLSPDELKALMLAATWMDAEEALARGFATEIVDAAPVAASFAPTAARALGDVPEKFRERVRAFIRAQEEDWRVGGDRDLPLNEERSWDADEADQTVRRWASRDGSGEKDQMDWAKYRRAFVVYDAASEENFTAYKLGFADVVDGRLTAIRRGLVAVRAVLNGARGGIDIPEAVKERAKAFVDGYLGPQEEEAADAAAVLAAVAEAGLDAPFARLLVEARLPLARAQAKIAEVLEARRGEEERARAIRALCETARLPELADSYIRGGMAVEEIKAQLTLVTGKLDKTEIDGTLRPDQQGSPRPQLDVAAIYRERK
jgi:ATP-dependent protease ClpP protease subunit